MVRMWVAGKTLGSPCYTHGPYLSALIRDVIKHYIQTHITHFTVSVCIVRYHDVPIISAGPHNQTVHVGDTVRFTCDVLSDAPCYVQWLKHLDEDVVVDNVTRNYVVIHVSDV